MDTNIAFSPNPGTHVAEVSDDIVVLRNPHSSRAADLRRLAQTLALRWFGGDNGHRALAVISPDRYEGRSTVAANLACLFATGGVPTLLIDADMQNPSLHHKFGSMTSQPSPIGGQRIRGLDHLTVVPAADLLKVEQAPLIHSPLQSLIERRRAEFGAIFIDTGAAATSNDYQVAALAGGGALLVTRDGVTRARRASRMLDSCDDAGLSVVGGIMLTA
ncbi:hypothetical protein QP166_05895 [Sphingomonas sp. LR60]|uniref:tyrosine-protein kinase family protein n=1 Tax=Sphingomonas sp. LR60 TaxID=3050233 RepID=UPI002FE20945